MYRNHMRTPNKPRMRHKSNRRSPGSAINRVFESSGPEGKVRGNPQQIIDKYLALSRDALLGGDRIASENYAQHSEHYARLLNEAQRELEARREQHESQQRQRQADYERRVGPPQMRNGEDAKSPLRVESPLGGDLVETPEGEQLSASAPQPSEDPEPISARGAATGTA